MAEKKSTSPKKNTEPKKTRKKADKQGVIQAPAATWTVHDSIDLSDFIPATPSAFYTDVTKEQINPRNLDKFRGCLVGGAVGDALGYEVEFMGASSIFNRFGPSGITEYVLHNGVARISDDTQMTLFTATGLLLGITRGRTRGIMGPYESYVGCSYRDWLNTQKGIYPKQDECRYSWLSNVRELHSQRAPGTTCLNALAQEDLGTTRKPINHSKGCGGVMRVAPIGLYFIGHDEMSAEDVTMIGAEAAALTHGHELGYIPAAILTHMIYQLAGDPNITVLKAVDNAVAMVKKVFPDAKHMNEMIQLIDQAKMLAQQNVEDLKAIKKLGEGWVAEETLAIAIYCALKYENDFDKALIASVNHSGDSDSTGAVTGNILGARLGLEEIPEKYINNLELCDLVVEIADDLFHDCQISEFDTDSDPVWVEKYLAMTYGRSQKPKERKKYLWQKTKVTQAVSSTTCQDLQFFWHEYEPFGEFSQWYASPFVVEGIRYETAEQYMAAKKALLAGDLEHYVLIMHEKNPEQCKKYGQSVRALDVATWTKCKEEVVYHANHAKFTQNSSLKDLLLSTGDKVLAEASPYDKIWGIGLDAKHPDSTNPSKWKGENLLGKILMKVREELRRSK